MTPTFWPEVNCADTMQDTVAVISPAGDEGVYHSVSSCFIRWPSYSLQLSQVVETLNQTHGVHVVQTSVYCQAVLPGTWVIGYNGSGCNGYWHWATGMELILDNHCLSCSSVLSINISNLIWQIIMMQTLQIMYCQLMLWTWSLMLVFSLCWFSCTSATEHTIMEHRPLFSWSHFVVYIFYIVNTGMSEEVHSKC